VLGRAGPSVVAAKMSTTHSPGPCRPSHSCSQPSRPGMCNDGDHHRKKGNGLIDPRRPWHPDQSIARPCQVPMAETPQRARGRMRLAMSPHGILCPLSSVLTQARHNNGGTREGSLRQSSGVSRTGGGSKKTGMMRRTVVRSRGNHSTPASFSTPSRDKWSSSPFPARSWFFSSCDRYLCLRDGRARGTGRRGNDVLWG